MPTNPAQDAADAARVRVRTVQIIPPQGEHDEPVVREADGTFRELTEAEMEEYDRAGAQVRRTTAATERAMKGGVL